MFILREHKNSKKFLDQIDSSISHRFHPLRKNPLGDEEKEVDK